MRGFTCNFGCYSTCTSNVEHNIYRFYFGRKYRYSISACQVFDETLVRRESQLAGPFSKVDVHLSKGGCSPVKLNNSYAVEGFVKVQSGANLTKYDLCTILSSCTKRRNKHLGLQVHAMIIENGLGDNVVLNSALVDFYAKCGRIEHARRVFDGMKQHDQVSWTSIISGYSQCGLGVEASLLFKKMLASNVMPNSFTYVSLIGACAGLEGLVEQGSLIHAHIIKLGFMTNSFLASSLIDHYSKCARLAKAVSVFSGATTKDNIVYNSMISGYCQNSYYEEALRLFVHMREEGSNPTHFTMSSILNASGRISVLQLGRQLHCLVIKLGSITNAFVLSSLVDMYSKCGTIDEAHHVFDQTIEKNNVLWTSMVSGYAQSGRALEALQLFDQMMDKGILPDHICFTAVFTTCNHSGFLDKAMEYFDKMTTHYGLVPTLDQYGCLIDLHARKGHLTKAMQLMDEMTFDPNCVILSSLLSCCKTYGAVELGREVANRLFKLQPHDAAACLTMAHLYAEAGLWDEVTNIRKLINQKQLKKSTAWSWIEAKGRVGLRQRKS